MRTIAIETHFAEKTPKLPCLYHGMVPGGLRTTAQLRPAQRAHTDQRSETPAPQASQRALRSQDETLGGDLALNCDLYRAAHGGRPTTMVARLFSMS